MVTGAGCQPAAVPVDPALHIEALDWTEVDFARNSVAAPEPDGRRDLRMRIVLGAGVQSLFVMSVGTAGAAVPIAGLRRAVRHARRYRQPDERAVQHVHRRPDLGHRRARKRRALESNGRARRAPVESASRTLDLHLGDPNTLEGSGVLLRAFAVTLDGDLIGSEVWPTGF